MINSIQKTAKGLFTNQYLRFFIILVLVVAVIFALVVGVISSVACTGTEEQICCSIFLEDEFGLPPLFAAFLAVFFVPGEDYSATLSPDEEVGRLLYGVGLDPAEPVTFVWTPPDGATDFEFPPGCQPQPGGPPFVFNDVPVATNGTAELRVSYRAPTPPGNEMYIVDTLLVQQGENQEAGSFRSVVTREQGVSLSSPGQTITQPQTQGELQRTLAEGVVPQDGDDYYLWKLQNWFYTGNIAMNTTRCQQLLDFAREGNVFFALRFPLPPGEQTDYYSLPVVFRGEYSPILSLLDESEWPHTKVLTVPLEYKPEYMTFLENELPSKEGERWLALGVSSSDNSTCPAGLELASGDWEFFAELWLDFGGEQGTWVDRVLPCYFCCEGDELPPFLETASEGFTGYFDQTSYQGWGITGLGPYPLRLTEMFAVDRSPQFELWGIHSSQALPGKEVRFVHAVRNYEDSPVTVAINWTSELGIPWGIYSGDSGGPDEPLNPITGPIVLGTSWPESNCYFWMIAEVPGGTADGPETLTITGTDVASPDQSTWTSDVLWVGEWEAPPGGNQAPVADAGPDQTVDVSSGGGTGMAMLLGSTVGVTLDGSGSYDPEGAPLSYNWTWDGGNVVGVGPVVELASGTTTITLVVNDGTLDSEPDTVDITVEEGDGTLITGITGEANCVIVAEATVDLYKDGGKVTGVVSDGQGNYSLPVAEIGDYEVVTSKTGYKDETHSITIGDLEQGYELDLIGEKGLVPKSATMAYVLQCVNHWLYPPGDECDLTMAKVLATVNAWLYPT